MSRLRANSITNKTANGAPTATNGLEVTGVCTATDFSGQSGGAADFPNGLTGTTATFSGNLGVGGVLTYEDVTNVDSLGVGTFRDGLRVTGICTATAFHGNGSALTGIVAGISTETISPSGITTHLLLSSADDHKVLATGNVTIDVTGGTEATSHQVRIENVGIATVGFSTAFMFPSGGTPILPTASGSLSLITFTVHKTGAAGTTLLAGASVNFS
nr:phage tail fiber-like protein [uncultured Mediterranean phage uvMED]